MTTIWLILRNLGSILELFNVVGRVLKGVSEGKRLPECQESIELIKTLRKLIDKKIIDVPNVDEEAISIALKSLEDNIQCKV